MHAFACTYTYTHTWRVQNGARDHTAHIYREMCMRIYMKYMSWVISFVFSSSSSCFFCCKTARKRTPHNNIQHYQIAMLVCFTAYYLCVCVRVVCSYFTNESYVYLPYDFVEWNAFLCVLLSFRLGFCSLFSVLFCSSSFFFCFVSVVIWCDFTLFGFFCVCTTRCFPWAKFEWGERRYESVFKHVNETFLSEYCIDVGVFVWCMLALVWCAITVDENENKLSTANSICRRLEIQARSLKNQQHQRNFHSVLMNTLIYCVWFIQFDAVMFVCACENPLHSVMYAQTPSMRILSIIPWIYVTYEIVTRSNTCKYVWSELHIDRRQTWKKKKTSLRK